MTACLPVSGPQEEQQRLQEEQEKKAREATAASKSLNVTVDVQVRPGRQGGEGPGSDESLPRSWGHRLNVLGP